MGQSATNVIPPKGYGTMTWRDAGKTVFLAAATNVLLSLYAIINAGGWPTNEDWHVMIKATLAIVLANIIKAISTNNVGELFTKDKPVVAVGAEELNQLKEQAKPTTP